MDRRKFIGTAGKAGLFFLLNPYSYNSVSVVVENLIIGTGYGGAVTALRLTQAGHKVTMLEMGLDWENNPAAVKPFSKMGSPSNNSTWLSNTTKAPFLNITTFSEQYTGILDRWDFEHVKIYMGRGVGGGSLVNGGMSVTPKRPYFEEVFPQLDSNAFYDEFFPLANSTLQVNLISNNFYNSSEYYKFSRIGVAEAQNAGFSTVKVPNVYDFDYMHKEEYEGAEQSAMDQEVIYGNNHGKNSLEKTYIQQARATGLLTIHDLHQVDSIKQRIDELYEVEISILSTDGSIIGYKKIITNRLFMAAGSLGTTKLLLKARKTGSLPNLDASIGEKWGNNGNIMAGRWYVNTIFNPVETGQNDGRGTGTKQATIPVDGVDNWEDSIFPYFVEIAPFPTGIEGYAALYLLINRVPELGKLHYHKNNEYEIIPEWDGMNNVNMIDNARNFLDRMIDANGGTYTGVFENGIAPDICYHPLGGCVIGHATDNYGRVNNHEGLYVMDGALIPGTIGVNPYVTITAIAEHNIQTILAEDFLENHPIMQNTYTKIFLVLYSILTATFGLKANDFICNATPLSVNMVGQYGNCNNLFPYDNTDSGFSSNEPIATCFDTAPENTFWFSFIAPTSGFVTITTDFWGGTNTDTQIAVFSGNLDCPSPIFNNLTEIACDQDSGTFETDNALLSIVTVAPNNTYYIQVSSWGYPTIEGTFCIDVTELFGQHPSDDCSTALTVMESPVNCTSAYTSTTLGTSHSIENNHTNGHEMWLDFTATSSNLVIEVDNITSVGFGNPTKAFVAIYTGTCGNLIPTNIFGESPLSFTAIIGMQYFISIETMDTTNTDMPANFHFCIHSCINPINDLCSNATVLNETMDASTPTYGTTSCSNMTTENSTSIGKEVWYQFTPNQSIFYNFDCNSSGANHHISIFEGTCATLNLVEEGISPFSVSMEENNLYYVLVTTLECEEWAIEADFSLSSTPICPLPSNFQVQNVNENSVELSWYLGNQQNMSTSIEICPSGTTTGDANCILTTFFTGMPLEISGLLPCTNYDVFVTQNCSNSSNNAFVLNDLFTTKGSDYTTSYCGDIVTYPACVGTTLDNNQNYTFVVCPDNPFDFVSINFTYFDLETSTGLGHNGMGCWDFVEILDGDGSTSFGTFCSEANGDGGVPSNPVADLSVNTNFTSSTPGDCITVFFYSDKSIEQTGFTFEVSCTNTFDACAIGYENMYQLTGIQTHSADFETDQGIDSDQVIQTGLGIDYDAKTCIELLPNFEVQLGAEFDAFIDGCDNGGGGNQ